MTKDEQIEDLTARLAAADELAWRYGHQRDDLAARLAAADEDLNASIGMFRDMTKQRDILKAEQDIFRDGFNSAREEIAALKAAIEQAHEEIALFTDTLTTVRQTVAVTTRQMERLAGTATRLRDGVREIASRGPVFDHRGTESSRICALAERLLADPDVKAVPDPPVATLLGEPINMKELKRISSEGP